MTGAQSVARRAWSPTRRPGRHDSDPATRIRKRLVIVQIQPALDNTVQHPDADGPQDRNSDHHEQQHATDRIAEQTEPEGTDLPLEVSFVRRAGDIRTLH